MLRSAKISVLMATYNAHDLCRSIESVLGQTYQNIELVIVNDGGSPIKSLIESYADDRIKLIELTENVGLAAALNCGLIECSGEYVARMDADDISLPHRLQAQLNYLNKMNLDLIGCWTVDYDGNRYRPNTPSSEYEQIVRALFYSVPIYHPTFFGKKSVFTEVLYDDNLRYSQDYDFVARSVILGVKVGNLPAFCLIYFTPNKNDIMKEVLQITSANRIAKQYSMNRLKNQPYNIQSEEIVKNLGASKFTKLMHHLKQRHCKTYYLKLNIIFKILFLLSFRDGQLFLIRNITRKYQF